MSVQHLRKPFFIASLVLLALVVLVELGSLGVVPTVPVTGTVQTLITSDAEMREVFEALSENERQAFLEQDKPPGRAIPYLALLDGILLFIVVLMSASLLIPERIHGRLQGIMTFVFSLLVLLGSIVLILAAIFVLTLMLSLFFASPFGTLAYLAIYGFFNKAGASVAISLVMSLKLGFAICLVLAHQQFLQNRGLVLLILTSFIGTVVISFLHSLVPSFLVSVTDAVAAIIVAVLALLWALFFLIGSLGAVIRALRVDRA